MSYLIDEHLTHLKVAGKSEDTRDARSRVLWRLHNYLPMGLAYACTEQLEAWLASPGWSRWTLFTYTGHVIGFYRWATENAHLDGNPAATIKRPKAPKCRPRPVQDDTLALALACPEPLRTAVMLAALAGMRRSEIARAKREHITEEAVLIPISKGGDWGEVPTHPDLWTFIKDRPPGRLILDLDGHPVTGPWLGRLAYKRFHSMGMPEVTMHKFRHWYGTMIQRTWGDLRVTQECLRHANVSSTQIYTQVSTEQRVRAVGSLALPGETGSASY